MKKLPLILCLALSLACLCGPAAHALKTGTGHPSGKQDWKTSPAKNSIGISFGDVSGGFMASYERLFPSQQDALTWTFRAGWGKYGDTSIDYYDNREGWLLACGMLAGKSRWQWQNEIGWMSTRNISAEGDLALLTGLRRNVSRNQIVWRGGAVYLPYTDLPSKFGFMFGFGVGF